MPECFNLFKRQLSRIARNRKLDRKIAATPLAGRTTVSETFLEELRSDLSGVLTHQLPGNSALYGALLQKCASNKALPEGIRLHKHISETAFAGDTFLWNLLIQMYASCGCLQEARAVFEEIQHPNVYSWNIMASAYAQNEHLQSAFDTFQRTPNKDVISWSTMITAYTQNGQGRKALKLFCEMDLQGTAPNKVTFLSALEACAGTGALIEGKEIYIHISSVMELKNDAKIETALVNMYGKCGKLNEARALLEAMLKPSVVTVNAMVSAYTQHGHMSEAESLFQILSSPTVSSWNTLIKGYAQTGHISSALRYFRLMDLSGFQPDTITSVSLFDASANIPALPEGKLIHSSIENLFHLDSPITTSLVFMYGKCGNLRIARKLFKEMPAKDIVPWTAMIAAYAHNGHGDTALELFQQLSLEGGTPNIVTFNTILCACSHGGLLHHAHEYFMSMREFGIQPSAEHYGCVLDILGRVGKLREAEELVYSMPFEPDSVDWTALLGACSTHGDIRVADRLFSLSSKASSSPYVLLYNIYRENVEN